MTDLELQSAYDEHADSVFRFAFRMAGTVAVAEDVVQDCFLELARGTARFDPARGSLRVFLLGVARRRLSRQWRSESRFDTLGDDDRAVEPYDPEAVEIAAAVAASIQALSPLQREALILAEYEGLKIGEIAVAVQCDPGAVKARLHRARQNLRKALAHYAPNPEVHPNGTHA